MKNSESVPAGLPRREFIKKTATAAAGIAAVSSVLKTPVYGQNTAPSTGRVIGANDRINVAVIGVGFGIGKDHLQGMHSKASENNIEVMAACDLFSKRRNWAKDTASLKDANVYSDHRKLLENKDIDAVLIATHDVWHAQLSIDSMEAGKHVYCEKPMTRYLDEAFKVADTVKKTGKIYQVGSQGCSAAGWHKCAELINSGKVGQLVWGQGYYCRNSVGGEWNYPIEDESTAANIDWERWLGQVKTRSAFSAEHFHRWRKYTRYCAGLLGDLVPHRLHPLMLASGKPEFPSRVVSIGTKNVHQDRENDPPAPEREVPEHVQLLAEFPSGYMVTITTSTVSEKSPGFVIYAHKASLNIGNSGERIELTPEKKYAEDVEMEQFTGLQPEDIRVHEKNWFDCIRANKQPNANIDLAIKVQTVISLAEMSDRMKTACLFDEKTRRITDGAGKEVAAITYGSMPLS
jgi:predicted dehydrogenase